MAGLSGKKLKRIDPCPRALDGKMQMIAVGAFTRHAAQNADGIPLRDGVTCFYRNFIHTIVIHFQFALCDHNAAAVQFVLRYR